MCGIAGILTRHELPDTATLLAMRKALRHRGPDDEGIATAAIAGGWQLALVHTRLAILDVSVAGHQPMHEPLSDSWIAYNGEIYNHLAIRQLMPEQRWRGTSDTETILTRWVQQGQATLEALRGMFAFALYDGRRRQFWLVRDRLGVKPLYVSQTGPETWVFASELRALLASGLVERRLHGEAVNSYLAFGAVSAPWTLVENVSSVLPGEAWRFDLDKEPVKPQRTKYWQPAFAAGPCPNGDNAAMGRTEAVEGLRSVLAEAVKLRMLSDVPVGVFLSGGIDSGAVVASLVSQGFRLRTFSVTFGEKPFDESEHARQVSRQFGTEHAELLLHPSQVLAEFEHALDAYDQPSIDGFNTYFISQATRHAGVKVALSGLGGDELFAGYPYFRYVSRFNKPAQRGLARVLHGLLRRVNPNGIRTQKLGALLSSGGSRLSGYGVCRQVMLPHRREDLLHEHHVNGFFPLPHEVVSELETATAGLDPVNAHSLLELALYLSNMLLRDTDQMSMAHALEVREPLLDHVLVDYVARLPGPLKMVQGRQGSVKGLLLDALPSPLPDEVVRRPKMGFVFPWEHWLRQELKPRVSAALTDKDTLEAAGLDVAGVQHLWQSYLSRRPGLRYTDVLCLLNLISFVQRNHLSLHKMPAPVS
jgi:asparagine synthase (glutamine-hydrolysing)